MNTGKVTERKQRREDRQRFSSAVDRMNAATTTQGKAIAAIAVDDVILRPLNNEVRGVRYVPNLAKIAADLKDERMSQSQRHCDVANDFGTSLTKVAAQYGVNPFDIHRVVRDRLQTLTQPS